MVCSRHSFIHLLGYTSIRLSVLKHSNKETLFFVVNSLATE